MKSFPPSARVIGAAFVKRGLFCVSAFDHVCHYCRCFRRLFRRRLGGVPLVLCAHGLTTRAMMRRNSAPPSIKKKTMKKLLASKTILGALLAMFAKIYGLKNGDAQSALDSALVLWPLLLGIGADLKTVWLRVSQCEFQSGVFRSPAFWAQVVSGVATIAAAFGCEVPELHDIFQRALSAGPALVALLGTLGSIYGAVTAQRVIEMPVPRAVPVE